jgi:RimJ/RimL family protein N-acetyltransferase
MAPSIKAILFDDATWRELGPRLLELERQEWGSRAFSQREMRWQVTNPDAVVMTTWDGPTLIGFAVAGPAWNEGRVTLLNVLIDPDYRGRGLVWPLIAAVGRRLFAQGIRELDIDARVDNGFANNVERHYGPRARVIRPDHPSPYGPQRTIRVTLVKGVRSPRRTRAAPSRRTVGPPAAGPARRVARTRPPSR